jgi:hypothetical protein
MWIRNRGNPFEVVTGIWPAQFVFDCSRGKKFFFSHSFKTIVGTHPAPNCADYWRLLP